jgi:hypothetical protein
MSAGDERHGGGMMIHVSVRRVPAGLAAVLFSRDGEWQPGPGHVSVSVSVSVKDEK